MFSDIHDAAYWELAEIRKALCLPPDAPVYQAIDACVRAAMTQEDGK